jgi:predicted aminopeptidase
MGQWRRDRRRAMKAHCCGGRRWRRLEEKLKQRREDTSQSEQDFIGQSLQERERIKQAEDSPQAAGKSNRLGDSCRVHLVALAVSTGSGN